MSLFTNTARELLTLRGLLINGTVYELAEVEFYLTSKDHSDPYTHQHPEQKLYAKWGFHRASDKADAKYRGGTFKGLDLTLGNENTYYGILIRSIYSKTTGVICGPCKVVNTILEAYKVASIEEFVSSDTENPSILDAMKNHREFHLVALDKPVEGPIYVGARIGLAPRRAGDDDQRSSLLNSSAQEWANKPYRFVRRYTEGKFKAKRSLEKVI